jgi:uncharacterized protein YndB with AHSA1/START domain
METKTVQITVETNVKAPIDKVWKLWNDPVAITKWCTATPEWHTPRAENDLKIGGKFFSRMEAKDQSMGFDFGGQYTTVKNNELIEYTMDDGRKVKVAFTSDGNETNITETFDAETQNPIEMQKGGWQAILDSFKNYAETH